MSVGEIKIETQATDTEGIPEPPAVAFGIGLLVEDILAFVNGQDSVLGDAAKRWTFIADAIDLVKAAIQGVIDF